MLNRTKLFLCNNLCRMHFQPLNLLSAEETYTDCLDVSQQTVCTDVFFFLIFCSSALFVSFFGSSMCDLVTPTGGNRFCKSPLTYSIWADLLLSFTQMQSNGFFLHCDTKKTLRWWMENPYTADSCACCEMQYVKSYEKRYRDALILHQSCLPFWRRVLQWANRCANMMV